MEIAKVFDKDSIDKVADNLFSAVSNSVSEVKAMQQRKAAENVQLVIQALKKIESEIQNKFDGVTGTMEKRIANIRDGRNGTDGRDGRDGKDGKPGRDGAPGPRGPAGVAGKDGKDGKDGISVTNAKIDFDGSLIISLSNGREVNVGEVIDPGLQERIKYISNGGAVPQYILDTLTSLQAQITALQNLGAVNYVGTWNATTNSPAITGGTGDKGDYYVVNVAGNTTIDGQSNWGVGDWIIFNGTAWQKVDGGDTGNLTNLNVSGTTTLSALTASQAVFTNASKELVSNAVTGTGNVVMSTSPVLTTPNLGTPSAATLTNATGLPIGTGVSGLGTGVATALAVNTGSSGAFVVNGGALGTPSSGTVTNLTGTASININGTVGATTANSGAFTTLTTSSTVTHNGGTANGVAYLNGSKVLTTGSALTFDGSFYLSLTGAMKINSNGYKLRFYDATGATGYGYLYTDGTNLQFDSGNSQPLSFLINGSEQMRLTSTGLGIGTSSPGSKLDVLGSAKIAASTGGGDLTIGTSSGAAQYQYITFGGSSGGQDGWQIGRSSTSSGLGGNGAFYFYDIKANTTRMSIDTSGNLGLGVTPSAWGSSLRALQIGYVYGGALSTNPAGNTTTHLTHNAWFDGTNWKYGASSIGATRYTMDGQNAGGTHSWSIAAGGTAGNAITFTQAMTLDASGNLALGLTSATGKFELASGSGSSVIALRIRSLSGNSNGFQIVTDSTTDNIYLNNYYSAAMMFGTNNTERARITSGGVFLINRTALQTGITDVCKLQVLSTGAEYSSAFENSNASTPYGLRVKYSGASPNGTGSEFLYCDDSTALRASIRSNGGIANYSANDVNLSDRREKTNFAPAKSYLDTICAIPVQTFEYIDQSPDDPGLTLGVVAQDVQIVAPELVMESNWGTEDNPKMRLSIYQTDLQYALMKCIQELKAELDSVKSELAALKGA